MPRNNDAGPIGGWRGHLVPERATLANPKMGETLASAAPRVVVGWSGNAAGRRFNMEEAESARSDHYFVFNEEDQCNVGTSWPDWLPPRD